MRKARGQRAGAAAALRELGRASRPRIVAPLSVREGQRGSRVGRQGPAAVPGRVEAGRGGAAGAASGCAEPGGAPTRPRGSVPGAGLAAQRLLELDGEGSRVEAQGNLGIHATTRKHAITRWCARVCSCTTSCRLRVHLRERGQCIIWQRNGK